LNTGVSYALVDVRELTFIDDARGNLVSRIYQIAGVVEGLGVFRTDEPIVSHNTMFPLPVLAILGGVNNYANGVGFAQNLVKTGGNRAKRIQLTEIFGQFTEMFLSVSALEGQELANETKITPLPYIGGIPLIIV
jgi:hypothetical protein